MERLFWLGRTLTQLVVLGLFVRYGVRWTRESAAGPIGTGMLLGMIGFALVWAAELPFAVLDVWWRHRYGLSGSYVQATIGDWLALGVRFVFLCAALAVVMGLARVCRIGDGWWLPAAPVFVGLTILFAFVTPWLLGGTAFDAPYVTPLERTEHVHVPVRVLDGFDEPNAFATGLGASRRVFLWEPIVEPPFTPRMDRFVLAHELGHLEHN
ncbi:MAG: M48 family metalloprotease, partial [Gaiellaceae bacterium]